MKKLGFKQKAFTPAEFRAWCKRKDIQADARPFTGLYRDGERVGHYCEVDSDIVVTSFVD